MDGTAAVERDSNGVAVTGTTSAGIALSGSAVIEPGAEESERDNELVLSAAEIAGFAARVLEYCSLAGWELSIRVAGPAVAREMNREYRGRDEPTDVLSFSQIETNEPELVVSELSQPRASGQETGASGGGGEEGLTGRRRVAGDLLLCQSVIVEQAYAHEVSPQEELCRVLTHGILHLAGWDHETYDLKEEMLRFQEQILDELLQESCL